MNNLKFKDEVLTSESKRPSKKTLNDLLSSKEVITGKEVVQNLKEKEKRQKEYEESVEFELRNRRRRLIATILYSRF